MMTGLFLLIMIIDKIEIKQFCLYVHSPMLSQSTTRMGLKIMKKTASFAVLHMATAFTVAWAMTGSVAVGGAVALVEPAVNTVVYFFHEKIWQRLQTTASPVAGTLQL